MLASITIFAMFFLLGYTLLGGYQSRAGGAVKVGLSILLGVPISIVLASFLLICSSLSFTAFIAIVALYLLGCLIAHHTFTNQSKHKLQTQQILADTIKKTFRTKAMLHYAYILLDLTICIGICLATFYIRKIWQDTNAPDVWTHINWADKIADTGQHNYCYMPGLHILIWIISKFYTCSIYTAGVNLSVFLTMYLPLAAYFAGTWAFNRTTGLLSALVYISSPALSLTYNSTLLLPRNLGHDFFILGLLLTTAAIGRTAKKGKTEMIAAGAVIGAMVITHLAWDEVLGTGAWAFALALIAVIYRNKIAHSAIILLTAFTVTAPFMAKMIYQKLQPDSFFNINPGRLLPFTFEKLYQRIYPVTVWIAIFSATIFWFLWLNRSKLLSLLQKSKISVSKNHIQKSAFINLMLTAMAIIACLLLFCIGKGGIEKFVYGTLPLPHPINSMRFIMMLALGLLGATGLLGYLPACLKGTWKLTALGIAATAFVLVIYSPELMSEYYNKENPVFANSKAIWLLLGATVMFSDYKTSILKRINKRKIIIVPTIIVFSCLALVLMPSLQPIERFIHQAPEFVAKPTPLQQWLIKNSSPNAVIVSHWPYLGKLEYLLDRKIADGLLGPQAIWVTNRSKLPGKYWHTLKFVNNKIANKPEKIADALHQDFGPEVYLYFRITPHNPFEAHKRKYHFLNPYSSKLCVQIHGQPPIENTAALFRNMIAYFLTHRQYFREIGKSNQSILFKVEK